MFKFKLHDPNFLPHCRCDVELSLQEGVATLIAGENGLGKTTLLHRFYCEHSTESTLVEQGLMDLFYDRNLAQIKKIFLSTSSGEIDESFFENCWEKFGLSKKENRYQSSLSGGEGQALKICLGLARISQMYLLDEPSQYLDDDMKNVLNNCIMDLLGRNKTVLIIEHDYKWADFPILGTKLEKIDNTIKAVKTWNT